jgi:hypothetical protein
MSQTKLFILGAVVFLFIVNLFVGYRGNASHEEQEPAKVLFQQPIKSTSFSNPTLAAKIINMLEPEYKPKGDTKLAKYCDKVLDWLVNHPQKAMKNMHFASNYPKDNVPGKMMRKLGEVSKSKEGKYKYSPDVNCFVEAYQHDPERQIRACPHQISNHILGNSQLGNKDTVAALFQDYRTRFDSKPQCLENFMPETYILTKKTQCKAFFNHINSKKYEEQKKKYHIVFMEKLASGIEAHSANGVKPLDPEGEQRIRTLYKNGDLCGKQDANIIMQSYISNPQLIEGRKFDMRVHLFIASTTPLIVYYYDGYFRTSMYKFNATSNDLTVHLSNNHFGPPEGMTREESKRIKNLNMEDLGKFLVKTGVIKSEKWIETDLKKQLQKAMVHLTSSAKTHFEKRPNYYEMYGCDFLLDTDLNIWFMECQSDPGFNKAPSPGQLQGAWEITFGLLRSRIKRMIYFVNQLTQEIKQQNMSEAEIRTYVKDKQAEFDKINKNYFEEEFTPRKKNKFVKIIDENVTGTKKFGDLFPKECTAVLSK